MQIPACTVLADITGSRVQAALVETVARGNCTLTFGSDPRHIVEQHDSHVNLLRLVDQVTHGR